MKMWGGRFSKEPDGGFIEFSSSVGFDARLYPYDILCTRAWAGALKDVGVLSAQESESIGAALDEVEKELDDGSFEFAPSDEDIHTAVERRLVELIGPAGGKVRTGRSRNDQVACDMRLFVRDACRLASEGVRKLQACLLDLAGSNIDLVIAGHTHLQRAQPVLLAHALLSFVHMMERDLNLLACADGMADSLPLGSGALAGTGLPVDRMNLAEALGFSGVSQNSMDAVGDRDFVSAGVYAFSSIMIHLSRLSEQVILWCSEEFGLATLDDSWSTGSSLMPQKKNPDGFELVRGKTGRVVGDLMGLLTVMKGLPLTYNRDLQEDKEAFFDAFDSVMGCLNVVERSMATISFDAERAAETVEGGFITATDLADYMVSRGLDFPEAHRVTGEMVSYCVSHGKGLSEMTLGEMKEISQAVDDGVMDWMSVRASIERRSVAGGTAPDAVASQIAEARRKLSDQVGGM